MVRLLGLDAPDPMSNYGWGDPMLQTIHDAVSSAGTVMQSIATLISEAKVDVIKIPGLTEIFSTVDGTQRMIKRFTEANVAKSVINAVLVDAEEDWQRITVQFNGMPEVLQMYLQIAAGAADIPVTRFLGMSPAGLNATGDADMRNYYDRIHSDQELRFTPALEKLDAAIIASALGKHDPNIFYEWNSLWQMDETQKAAIASQKAAASMVDVNAGLIPFDALAKGRANQLIEDGTYPGLESALEESVIDEEMIAEQTEAGHERSLMPPPDPNADPNADPNDPEADNDNAPPKKKRPAFAAADSGMSFFDRIVDGVIERLTDISAWSEEKHSRGQPENAGQFGPGGYGGGTSEKTKTGPGRTARGSARKEASAKLKERVQAEHKSRGKKGAHAEAEEIRMGRASAFVSPNVASNLDLKGAEKGIRGKQQAALREASDYINKQTGVDDGRDIDVIGAWKDGAENSLLTTSDAPWDNFKLAAVMKAHLADQKSVLLFDEQEGGKTVLAHFNAKGKVDEIHRNLLEDGLDQHTIVPVKGGARVYVVDLDGSHSDAIEKGAARYGDANKVTVKFGRGEFIGTDKEDGSDSEQRDSAREVYEAAINESPVSDAREIWKEASDTWGETARGIDEVRALGAIRPAGKDPHGRLTMQPGTKFDIPELEKQTKASVKAASASATAKALPNSKATHPATIASREVTATDKQALAPKGVYGQPDVATMKLDTERFAHDIAVMGNEKFYSNFRAEDFAEGPDVAADKMVQQMTDNLKFLYQFADHDTQVWYDGARALVDDRAKLYGFNDASVAGVYAALSPTKDWDQNVHIADATMRVYKEKQDFKWDDEMSEKSKTLWSKANQPIVKAVAGKKLSECADAEEKALWIRTYCETKESRSYREVLPNGALGGVVYNADGRTPTPAVWQSLPSAKNAVMALEANGDREKISEAMGTAHKVRSFYNNILDPHSANEDVTIDTHAVGAALLRQLTSSDAAVMHDFGNAPLQKDKPEGWEAIGKSKKTGLSGSYPVYADAYRKAAKELGIQPRQLQSAVWVVKRLTFGAASEKVQAQIEDVWKGYHDGKGSLDSVRNEIAKILDLKKPSKENAPP
jgi:hypothetical protein